MLPGFHEKIPKIPPGWHAMKTCLLCNEYPPGPKVGGVGSFVRDLGRKLVEFGHNVTAVGIYDVREPVTENDGGVRVVRLPGGAGGRVGFFMDRSRLGRWVGLEASRGRVEVVEAPEGGGWSWMIGSRVPVVIRFHSSARFGVARNWRKPRGRLLSLIEELAIRKATGLIAVSGWVSERAAVDYPRAGLKGRSIEVIHNGIDLGLFRPRPWSDRVPGRVVFAGTLKAQKGVVTLLRAFSLIAAKRGDATLVVAGQDTLSAGRSYWDQALEMAKVPEVAMNKIERRDAISRESLAELYGSASVCIFPSLAESFGLVAVEAMACGRPVVYSSTTAGPELIDHGQDGLLADPQNPAEFAEAVLQVLNDEDLAERLGAQAARSAAARFSMVTCARRTVEFYTQVLGSAGEIHLRYE